MICFRYEIRRTDAFLKSIFKSCYLFWIVSVKHKFVIETVSLEKVNSNTEPNKGLHAKSADYLVCLIKCTRYWKWIKHILTFYTLIFLCFFVNNLFVFLHTRKLRFFLCFFCLISVDLETTCPYSSPFNWPDYTENIIFLKLVHCNWLKYNFFIYYQWFLIKIMNRNVSAATNDKWNYS